MIRSLTWLGILTSAAISCAPSTPGASPHDQSAASHDREAESHARLGEQHAAQYDPKASAKEERCKAASGHVPGGEDVCWTSTKNPTAKHLRAAEEHRKHAADHRAASAALRDAETRACAGIPPDDRDTSPFDHAEDIAGVEPLIERVASKAPGERRVGAIVTFHAVPGMTTEWLQRVVDCHLARNAALGHTVPEMPNCPLVPKGAEARVSSTGSGFAVAIRSEDEQTAREILARAQRLTSESK